MGSAPMRIAYVVSRYLPSLGGVETHVSEIARRVQQAGHEVEILTQREPASDLARVEVQAGVTVRRFTTLVPSRAYPVAPGLFAHLARHGYDCVHAHNYHALPALGAAISKRGPLVFTPHYLGGGHTLASRLAHRPYLVLGRLIFDRSDRVICTTRAEAGLVRDRFAVRPQVLSVIPNGVDEAAIRASEPLPVKGTVVLWAGRLERYKRADMVVSAMRWLPRDFHLYVVGDGPARAGLEQDAQRWGLGDRVRFTGGVPHDVAYRWFRTASVFVSMSSRESFGISILEAAAAGVPVVASDIPVHREVADEYGSGNVWLVPTDADLSALASTIERAAQTHPPALGSPLPSWDDAAASTLQIYRSLGCLRRGT